MTPLVRVPLVKAPENHPGHVIERHLWKLRKIVDTAFLGLN